MEVTRYGTKCLLKKANSSKAEEVEVFSFSEHKNLTVVLGKEVKIPMKWNGKMYEGKLAGIDLLSDGPVIHKAKSSRG
jgi:hypothetical protein